MRMLRRVALSTRTAPGSDSDQLSSRDDAGEWRRLEPIIEGEAARFSVSPAIHPADEIFRFMSEHPELDRDETWVGYYFEDGARSAARFTELLHKYCAQLERKPQVLEFASGYGCVTRHLARDHNIELESCDIHVEAVDFLRRIIGVHALPSEASPEAVSFPHQYDFVFALSFFSHMPIATWTRWLVRLIQSVRPGGVMAFTTHGLASRALHGNPEIPATGFWFVAASEQSDLSKHEYGSTIVTESFVRRTIENIPAVELVETRLGYWWQHQDLYVIRKIA
jgi:SAM-dependent methyltransferase